MNAPAHNLADMPGKTEADDRHTPLSKFVRAKLGELSKELGKGDSMKARAKAVKLPPSGVSQVMAGTLGVSERTVDRYAKLLGYPSTLALRTEVEGRAPKRSGGKLRIVKPHRYHVMPTVLEAAASDGIPEDFVRNFETGLDYPGQPSFSVIYELLKSTWNMQREKVKAKPADEADF